MGRAPCCDKVGLKKGRWTKEEDEILLKYIATNGEGSWRSLPKNAGLLRCGKSCRLRWINYLRADLKRGNITKEEEEIIIKLHASIGNRWSLIAGELPGRTDNEIKNYWNSHLSRRFHSFRRLYSAAEPTAVDLSKLSGAGRRRGSGRISRATMKKNEGNSNSNSTEAIGSREKRKEEANAANSAAAGSTRSGQSEEEAMSTVTDPDHQTNANSSSITSDDEMVAGYLCTGAVDQSGGQLSAEGGSSSEISGRRARALNGEGGSGHMAMRMGPAEVGVAVGVGQSDHEEGAGGHEGSLLLDMDLDAKLWEEASDMWSWLLDCEGDAYQEQLLHSWVTSDLLL